MKKIALWVVVVIAVAVAAGSAYAGCGSCCGSAGAASSKQACASGVVCNSTCPVLGGAVAKDTKFTADYKGNTIGFCCADCQAKFKANPEKYAANIK